MKKALRTSFIYALVFGGITHYVSIWAGFDVQETNLLYIFIAVIIFAGLIAPAIEDSIEIHNEKVRIENEKFVREAEESSSVIEEATNEAAKKALSGQNDKNNLDK